VSVSLLHRFQRRLTKLTGCASSFEVTAQLDTWTEHPHLNQPACLLQASL
jgi:hypothetical protein